MCSVEYVINVQVKFLRNYNRFHIFIFMVFHNFEIKINLFLQKRTLIYFILRKFDDN